MPTIRNVPLMLNTQQVLRRMGTTATRAKPQILDVLCQLLATAETFLKPAFVYALHGIDRVHHDELRLKDGIVLHSSRLASVMSSAQKLAAAVGTIGPALEEKVTAYFARNDPLRAVILDGIGNAAVDALSRETCRFIKHEVSALGLKTSSPLSPGMHDWSVYEQRQLLQLVPAEEIGVGLTPPAAMTPRKSFSMVVGVGVEMPSWTKAEVCRLCSMKETCRYSVLRQKARHKGVPRGHEAVSN